MTDDSGWRGVGDDDESDQENEDSEFKWGGRDALILLIDASKEMFVKKDNESCFDLSIKCARNIMGNKIFSSDTDLVGIIFFGTELTKNSANFPHITVFQDLEQPDADRILAIEKLMKNKNGGFEQEYGHNSQFSLSEVLWLSSLIISNCTMSLGSRRILLFTNNDDPHKGKGQLQQMARQKAADLSEIGIELDLLSMKNSDGYFDAKKFYKNLIFLADDEDEKIINDPTDKLQELLSRIRMKDAKKRRLTSITFSIGKDVNMAVSVYSMVRTTTLPIRVLLNKTDNEELKSMRKTYLADTGELLLASDIKKYVVYAKKKTAFEQEEVKELKRFFDPGLVLMGFKPRSSLKIYHHVRPSQFLFPDEDVVEGSSRLFAALLKRCHERQIIPICRYTQRRNTPPQFVALLPQIEQLSEDKVQIAPSGFHVIFLPFADDFRELKFENPIKADAMQIDKAKQLIKKIKFPFLSENFENPALQTHWHNLEALALDRDVPEKTIDYTRPDFEIMRRRIGVLSKEFKDLVYPSGYDPSNAGKRKAPASARGDDKRFKQEDGAVKVDLKKAAQEGKLGSLTVELLRQNCRLLGIEYLGGRKAELIESIKKHFNVTS